jgi:hypothetical protein
VEARIDNTAGKYQKPRIWWLLYKIQATVGWCKNYCIIYKQLDDGGGRKYESKSLQARIWRLLYQIQVTVERCKKQLEDGDVGEEKRVCRKSKTTRWLEVKTTHE